MARPIKDLAASVRQRLLDRARVSGRPFAELLQYFAMERFLYRLSRSEHVDKFVLKGALLLTAWRAPLSRPTKDTDLLGRTSNKPDVTQEVIRDVCLVETRPDGIVFDPKTVAANRTREVREESLRAGQQRAQLGAVPRRPGHDVPKGAAAEAEG